MKKFLAIAVIAAALTSCGGEKTEEATPAVDSSAITAPVADTAAKAAVDTAVKAVDSTVKAAVDSVKK